MGLIAMNKDNICDKLTDRLSEEDKEELRREYAIVTQDFLCSFLSVTGYNSLNSQSAERLVF